MKKVDGVETVRVSLKNGLTTLDLKAGNTITLARLRTVIKNNGFVSKEALIVARGRVAGASDHRMFEVSGTGEQLTPEAAPQPAGEAWTFVVKT